MPRPDDFYVKRTSRDYVLIRKGMGDEYHSHFKSTQGVDKLLKLISENHMPKNEYFRVAAQRVLTPKEFSELKLPKQKYVNKRR